MGTVEIQCLEPVLVGSNARFTHFQRQCIFANMKKFVCLCNLPNAASNISLINIAVSFYVSLD